MFFILVKSSLLFFFCLCIHIIVWRIKRPVTYITWFPTLFFIFIILGALGAFWMVQGVAISRDDLPMPWIEWLAIFLFHAVLSMVYIIGYTAVAAFSPSMELIKALDKSPNSLPHNQLATPFFEDIALSDSRINNLIQAELIQKENGYLYLARRGKPLTRIVLLYRHLIGLPDGEGG